MNVTNFTGLQDLLKIIAKEMGLSIKYQKVNELKGMYEDTDRMTDEERSTKSTMEHLGMPYTTPDKVIHVPMIKPTWSIDKQENVIAVTYHEAGHHSPESKDDFNLIIDNDIDMQTFYGRTYNLLSDYGNDRNNFGKYDGLDRMTTNLYDTMMTATYNSLDPDLRNERLEEEVKPEEIEDAKKRCDALDAMRAFDTVARGSWIPKMDMHMDVLDKISDRSSGWVQALLDKGYVERQDAVRTAKDRKDLLDAMLREFDIDPEELLKESQESTKAKGEGGEGEGAGEVDGEGGEGMMSSDKFAEMHWKDISHDSHNVTAMSEGSTIIYEDDDIGSGNDYTPDPDPEILTKKDLTSIDDDWVQTTKEYWKTSDNLAGVVRKLLQVRSQQRWAGQRRRGKLSARDLHRLATYQTDVFKQKDINLTKDVAVTLLIDWSGSMGGYSDSKFGCATMAAAELTNAITVNRIPLEILAFSHGRKRSSKGGMDQGTQHIILKSHNEVITGDRVMELSSAFRDQLGCNADGEAVMWAHERLLKQKKKRKVLIVLSDGQPSSSFCQDDPGFLLKVVQEIEESSPVELYAIGILTNSVEHFYKDNKVIDSPEDLEHGLLDIIKTKIIQ